MVHSERLIVVPGVRAFVLPEEQPSFRHTHPSNAATGPGDSGLLASPHSEPAPIDGYLLVGVPLHGRGRLARPLTRAVPAIVDSDLGSHGRCGRVDALTRSVPSTPRSNGSHDPRRSDGTTAYRVRDRSDARLMGQRENIRLW